MFCSHGWLQRSGWRYCDFGRCSSPRLLRIKSFYFHFGKPRIYLFNYNSFGHFTTKSLSVSNKLPNTKLDKTKIGKVSYKRLLIWYSEKNWAKKAVAISWNELVLYWTSFLDSLNWFYLWTNSESDFIISEILESLPDPVL